MIIFKLIDASKNNAIEVLHSQYDHRHRFKIERIYNFVLIIPKP